MPPIPPIGGLPYCGKGDNDDNSTTSVTRCDGSDSHQDIVNLPRQQRHPQEYEDTNDDEGSNVHQVHELKRNGDSSSITSASTATSTATSTSTSSKTKRHSRSNRSKDRSGSSHSKESKDGDANNKDGINSNSNSKSHSSKHRKHRKKKDRSTSTSSTRSTSTTISLKSHLEANNNIKKVGGACGGNTSAGASVDENKTIKTSNINASTAASASAGGSNSNTASNDGAAGSNLGVNASGNNHSKGNNNLSGKNTHHKSDRIAKGSSAAKKARAEAIAIAKAQMIANAKAQLNANIDKNSKIKQDGQKIMHKTVQDYTVSKDYRVSDLSCIDEADTMNAGDGKNDKQQQEQHSGDGILEKQKQTQFSYQPTNIKSKDKNTNSSSSHRSSPSRSPPGFFTKTRPHSTTPIPVIPATRYSLSGSSRSSQSHSQSLASSHSRSLASSQSQSLSSHSKSLSSSHSQSLSSSHSQSITSSSHSQSVTSSYSYGQSGSMRFTFGETPLEAEEYTATPALSSPLNLPEVSPISTSSAILAAESYTTGTANYPKNLLRQSTNTIDSDNNSFSSLVSSPTSAFVAVPPRIPTPLSVSKTASNITAKTGEVTLSSFETNYHERQSASSNGFDRSEDDLQSLASITSLTSLKSLASLNSGVSNSHSNFRSSHGDSNGNGNGNSNSHSLGHSSSTSILVSHEVHPQEVAEVRDKIQMYMDFKQNRQRMESEAIIARIKANPAGYEKSSSRDVGNDAYTTPPPLAPPFPTNRDKREANNDTNTHDTNESSRGADDDDDFFDTKDICNEYNNSSTSFIGTVDELPTAEQVQLRVKLRKERRRNSSSNSNKSGLSGLSGLSGSNRSGVSESVASVTSPASGVSGFSGNAVGGVVDLSVRKDDTKQQSQLLRSGIGGMSGVDYSSVRSDSEFSSQDQEGDESSNGPTSSSRQKKGSPYNEDSITSLSLEKRIGSGAETKLCSSLASVESSRDDGCGQSYRSSASSEDANLASSAQSNGSWRSFSSSHNNETVGSIGSGKVRKAKNLNDKAKGKPKQKEGFKKKRSSSISAAYEAAVVAKGGIFFDEAVGTSKRRGSNGDKNQVKGRKRDKNDLSNSLTEGSVVSSGSNNAPVSFLTTVSSRRTRDASINSHGGTSVMSNVSGLSWGSLRIFNNKNSKGAKKVREERSDNGLTASGVSESSSQLVDDVNKDDDGSVASDRSNESKSLQSSLSLKSTRSMKSAKSNRSIKSSRSDRTNESSKKSKRLESADKSKSGQSGDSVASAISAGSSKKKKTSEWESPQEEEDDEDEDDSDDDEDEEGATIPNSILSNDNFNMGTSTNATLGQQQYHEQMGASAISPSHWVNNDICSRIGIVGTSQGAPPVVSVAPNGVVASSYPSHAQSHAMNCKNTPSGILRGDGRYSPNDNFMETNRQHSSSRIKSILRGVQNRRDHSSDRNLDARSESSQKSKSSVLSSITATSTKLRGYLKSYRRRSSHSNEPHERPSQKLQGKSNRSEQSSGVLSQSKVPKYRPPINGPYHAMTTHMQRHPSTCNYVRNPPASHDFHNINLVNEGSKHRVKFHDNCSIANVSAIRNCNDSASVVTTRSASSMSSLDRRFRQLNTPNSNGVTTKVFDLPWYDGRPNGIKGRYSGPVNAFLQPHGQGIIFVEGNNILQFHGHWKNGALISSLSSHGILSPSAGLDQVKSDRDNSIQPGNKFDTASRDKMKAKDTLLDVSRDESPQSSTCSLESNGEESSKKCGRSSSAKGGRQKSTLKYSLGDVARTPRDMVILRSNKEAIQSASMIKKFQQCFIKRSNGLWTVAILADRAMQPANQVHTRHDDSIHSFSSTGQQHDSSRWYTPDEIDDSMDLEQSMLFVINSDGATKIIQKRHWGKYIRRLNDGSALSPGQESKKKEVREEDGKF